MEGVGLTARWGKADYRALQEMEERLQKLQQADMEKACRKAASKIAQVLLNKVKKMTPVGVRPVFDEPNPEAEQYWEGYVGGTLRDAWTVLPIERQGNNYVVTVVNNTEYASYVEYGHRQTPGRFVPALGKSLTDNWSKGRFMLTISVQETERLVPAILEKALRQALREVF